MPYISDFPFRFGPAPCCCPDPGCQSFSDDFYRANSTDLGSDWNEVSGDWEILNFMLHEKAGTSEGTAGAKVFCTIPTSAASPGMMYMQVMILYAVPGDKFSLYSCAETSSSLGSGVEVTFEMLAEVLWRTPGVPDWQITIVGGSAEGTVIQPTPVDSTIAYVCADHRVEMVTAGFVNTTDEKAWDDQLDPGTGRYCGLGHNNASTGAFFDDFYKVELHSGAAECTNCVCQCLDYGVKRSLIAEVFDVEVWAESDMFGALEGDTFTLEYDYDGIHPDPTWYGQWINSQNPPGAFIVDMYLRCSGGWTFYPDWPGYNITLNFGELSMTPCHDNFQGYVCQNAIPDPNYSTCNPLSLVYGWFYAWIDIMPPIRISRYKIRVTEA